MSEKTSPLWIVDLAYRKLSFKWTKEELLGYCELPKNDPYLDFLHECRDLGLDGDDLTLD